MGTFVIIDITGRKVKEFNLVNGLNYFEVNNRELNAGIYIGSIQCSACKKENKEFIVIE